MSADAESTDRPEPPSKKKRGADHQITKDDYDYDPDDEENDGAEADERLKQGFSRAPDDVLKRRKIVRVKRPSAAPPPAKVLAAAGPASGASGSNPFASTSLSAPSGNNGNTSGNGNPFAGAKLVSSAPDSAATSDPDPNPNPTGTKGGAEKEKETGPAKKKVFGFGSASGFGAASSANGTSGFGSSTGGGFAGVGSSGGGFGSSSGGASGFGSAVSSGGGETKGFGGFGSSSAAPSSLSNSNGGPTKSLFGSTGSSGISFNFSKADSSADAKGKDNPANLPDTDDLDLKTGEEDEETIHSGRCKAFEWTVPEDTGAGTLAEAGADRGDAPEPSKTKNPSVRSSTQFETAISTGGGAKDSEGKGGRWKELGTGPVKILRSTKHKDRLRLVQRRESSKMGPATKVILNAPLWKESTCERDRQAQQYLHLKTIKDGRMSQFLLKFREAHDAGTFHHHLVDQIPLTRRCFVPTGGGGALAPEEKKD
ncbi:unnamed protein product [Pseudo-nitzschia multistriata]|uniref:RanBD1 domain-containing protein n=1 Tax=Pseudo-nitzschia multistriata TaxID=183589 RepID=A0A448Z5J2_9STRA|nr:unnamed protein product [Pseudo-nitzschia multistriata]